MRVLLVGSGTAATRHARNVRDLVADIDGIHVVSSRSQLPELEALYGGVQIWRTVPSAVQNECFDAAIIAPASSETARALDACVRAEIPCLVEKPLGVGREDVRLIDDLFHDKGKSEAWKRSRMSFQYRFSPAFRELHRVISTGGLGELLGVSVVFSEYLPSWKPGHDWRRSYSARQDLGGGVLRTQCHELDLVTVLLGSLQVDGAIFGFSNALALDVEDSVHVLGHGRLFGDYVPVSVFLSMCRPESERLITASGSEGRAVLDLRSGSLEFGRTRKFQGCDRETLFRQVAADFLQSEEPQGATLEHGFELTRLLEDIRAAAARTNPSATDRSDSQPI